MAKEKTIKQSVINTFNRVGIPYEDLLKVEGTKEVSNWMSGQKVETSPLVAHCIAWVYGTSVAYEHGDFRVKTSDFDRIRYFVLDQDSDAYMTCLD
jgi:hypothetical protein